MAAKRKSKSVPALFQLVEAKDHLRQELADGPHVCVDFARTAMDQGHFALAYDLLEAGLGQFPKSLELRHLAALALAQSGSLEKASSVLAPALEQIDGEHPMAIEVLSLAGRIAKDRWRFATDRKTVVDAGAESVRYYLDAFDRTKDFFPGINAATMLRLTGDSERANVIASEVKMICERQSEPDHWCLATIAEANLLLGRVSEAENCYRRAATMALGRYSDLASMKRQLRLLGAGLGLSDKTVDSIAIPKVAALVDIFAGCDLNSTTARSGTTFEELTAGALAEKDVGFAYSSASCGTDLDFLTALQLNGKESTIVLPFDKNEFMQSRVAPGGDIWLAKFDSAANKATRTIVATREGYRGDDSLFSYATGLIIGLAVLRAKQLETDTVVYLVTDGRDDPDGDRKKEFLTRYKLEDDEVVLLDKTRASASERIGAEAPILVHWGDEAGSKHRQIMTMVFADVVSFSGFGEESTPAFVGFLEEIANIIDGMAHRPVFQNTWGDGLFLVFDDVAVAAQFALKLHETVVTTNWAARGLPANTNIRIGMHTGPVFPAHDKVIGRRNYFGTHVNRAARVEPVATPGASFATEETAAILAAQKAAGISLEYLGERPLAKGFGSHRLYRLRRESEVDHLV